MRVLIVSHTVFSPTESMGKTLSSYFSDFKAEELSQYYIHSQVPVSNICHNYFRMTDKDAIKSIIGLSKGQVFKKEDIQTSLISSRTDTGLEGAIYQKARKRTPLIYIARNLWWKLSGWNNKKLKQWLDEIKPQCIFLASGDYSFIYEIALKIAKDRNIPLFISCMDDYYFYNKNEDTLLGRLYHKSFMKKVKNAIEYSTKIFCICDKMSEDYSKFFNKECITIHTPTTIEKPLDIEKKDKISYLGNLGYSRDKQLIEIGKTLKSLNLRIKNIDIYSSETREEILKNLNADNGIIFHKAVGAKEVLEIMTESLCVIHTESFDVKSRQSVRYSVSTKIADSLASRTCIFAYGPEEIASIKYLKDNNAAICCTDKEDLKNQLLKLINDNQLRNTTIQNAIKLSTNHLKDRTPMIIRNTLEGIKEK